MLPVWNASRNGSGLKGKRIYIPPMAYGSGRMLASAFRAAGFDADITPPSDRRTRELGVRHTCGDECYPAKVTVGDFMKLLERPDIDPGRTVLLMPSADGPCRFGQYGPCLRQILDDNGYAQTSVLSPSNCDAYGGLGGCFERTAWRALVSADILQKLLLRYRPYERRQGDADRAFGEGLNDLCRTIESTPVNPSVQIEALRATLIRCRDRFRRVRISRDRARPLIGIVGEIFCRLHTFSNGDLVRRLEEYGGEAWMSDISEWIWYTNAERSRLLKLHGRRLSLDAMEDWIRQQVQRRDEHRLLEPFHDDFAGREEPPIEQVLAFARPYLPAEGVMGEMVVNVGRTAYLAQKGVDGVIDISPFACMNGTVCEAVYPRLSRDLGGLPIRNFYFDDTAPAPDGDLGVFLDLAWGYRQRKEQ